MDGLHGTGHGGRSILGKDDNPRLSGSLLVFCWGLLGCMRYICIRWSIYIYIRIYTPRNRTWVPKPFSISWSFQILSSSGQPFEMADWKTHSCRSPTFPNLSLNRALANLIHKMSEYSENTDTKVIHNTWVAKPCFIKFETGVSTWDPNYLTFRWVVSWIHLLF